MSYPLQSEQSQQAQQPTAAPGRIDLPDGGVTDATLPEDTVSDEHHKITGDVDQPTSAEPQRGTSDGQLPPGGSADDPVAALWGSDLVQRYRDQWQQLQLRFVDDPHHAVADAAGLLDDVVRSLTSTLAERKQALDGWHTSQGDTEVLRTALTRYRDFLDRLLGL